MKAIHRPQKQKCIKEQYLLSVSFFAIFCCHTCKEIITVLLVQKILYKTCLYKKNKTWCVFFKTFLQFRYSLGSSTYCYTQRKMSHVLLLIKMARVLLYTKKNVTCTSTYKNGTCTTILI